MNTRQCDKCGRFISESEFKPGGGASSIFIPSSDVSTEDDRVRCKTCTEKHGAIKCCAPYVESICCKTY